MRIGIDVGVTGALAFLEDDLSISDLVDMPAMLLSGKRHQVNGAEVARILRLWLEGSGAVTAFVERVAAFPGQGVSSMFGFGVSYGIIQGVLATLGIPMVLVNPIQWKKRAGLLKQPKDMARTIAQRLYPLAELDRKKDIGRADALLIARFGDSTSA